MILKMIEKEDWKAVKEIYNEAFPKREQKPFCVLKNTVKSGKANLHVAKENNKVLGFIVVFSTDDLIMVDYLAVSQKIRSKGTGSFILNSICQIYKNKRIVLLIEKLNQNEANANQRVARRQFYIKNGFNSSNIYMKGKSGDMEILCYGGLITKNEFLLIFEKVLGKLFFKLSKISLY